MKLDWQHVAILGFGLACMTTVIALGHGDVLIRIAAVLGGASGVAALLKSSPIGGSDE